MNTTSKLEVIQYLEQIQKQEDMTKYKRKHLKATINLLKGVSRPEPRIRNFTLYVLYLDGGNRYVGITGYKNASKRFAEHKKGKGAKWTQLHKPLYIESTEPLGSIGEDRAIIKETDLTLQLMAKHGVSKVRGGKLCIVDETNLRKMCSSLLRENDLQEYEYFDDTMYKPVDDFIKPRVRRIVID